MAATAYAIKSSLKGVLKPLGATDDSKNVPLNKSIKFSLSRESESLEAHANGLVEITIENNTKYTFTLSHEVVSEEILAMMMGCSIDETGKWIAGESAPTTVYSYEGDFVMIGNDGSKLVKHMTIPKVQCNYNGTVDFDSMNLSTFELPFTVLVDNNIFFEVETKA